MSSFYLKTFSWSQAAKSVLHKQSLGTRNNAVTGSDILQNTPLCQHFTKTPALPGIIQAPNVRWFLPQTHQHWKHLSWVLDMTPKMSGVACPKFEFWCSCHSFGSVFKKPPSAKLLLFGLLLGILCIDETEKIRVPKWSLAAFTEPSSGSMSALPSTTRNETWDLNMKMRKPMTSNEKQEMALVSSSLEFLNASQTPFRDKALKWMRQLRQPNAVWTRHSPSSGLLSPASLALYSQRHFQAAMICHNGHCCPVRLEKDVLPAIEVKQAAWKWWSHRRKRRKMPGYPQNASTLTPCRHSEKLREQYKKEWQGCVVQADKRPEFKGFICICLRLFVT